MERFCMPPLWSKPKIAQGAKCTNKVFAFNLLVPSIALKSKST